MLKCPYCGKKLYNDDVYCSNCKRNVYYHLNPDKKRKVSNRDKLIWIFLGVLCPIFGIIFFFIWYKKEKENSKFMLVGSLFNIGSSVMHVFLVLAINLSIILNRSLFYEEYSKNDKLKYGHLTYEDNNELYLRKSELDEIYIKTIHLRELNYECPPNSKTPYVNDSDKTYKYSFKYEYKGSTIKQPTYYCFIYDEYKVSFEYDTNIPMEFLLNVLATYDDLEKIKLLSGDELEVKYNANNRKYYYINEEDKTFSF